MRNTIKKATTRKTGHPELWQFYRASEWLDCALLARSNQYRSDAWKVWPLTLLESLLSPYEFFASSRQIFRAHACALLVFPLLIMVETGSIILDRLLVIISDIIASNIKVFRNEKGGEI